MKGFDKFMPGFSKTMLKLISAVIFSFLIIFVSGSVSEGNTEGPEKTTTLEEGQTIWFISHSSKEETVEIDRAVADYFDFEILDDSGEGYQMGIKRNPDELKIPPGGELTITSAYKSDSIGLTFEENKFSWEGIWDEALVRKTINGGETVKFTNDSQKKETLKINRLAENKFDYEIVDEKGEGYKKAIKENPRSLEVPGGGKAYITSAYWDDDIHIGSYSHKFKAEKIERTALRRWAIDKKETVRFKNNSEKEQSLAISISAAGSFDYEILDKDGQGYAKGVKENHKNLKIPGEGELLITSAYDDRYINAGGYSDKFALETTKENALEKITISKGETALFENNSEEKETLKIARASGDYFDYEILDEDGEGYEKGLKEDPKSLEVPAKGKVLITSAYDNDKINIGGYKEKFSAETTEDNALERWRIGKDETIRFINYTSEAEKLIIESPTGALFDYEIIDPQGNIYDSDTEVSPDSLQIPAKAEIKISSAYGDKGIIMGGYSEIFKNISVDEENIVEFEDKALENKIREKIQEEKDDLKVIDPLTKEELENIKQLNLSDSEIKNLKGLEKMKNLEHLDLIDNEIENLEPIKELEKLNYLRFSNNKVEDISPLKGLTNLRTLSFDNNKVSDISYLEELEKLERIRFSKNEVENISILEELPELERIFMEDNEIDDSESSEDMKVIKELRERGVRIFY